MTKRSTETSFEDLVRQKTLQGNKNKRNTQKKRSNKSEKTLADLMGHFSQMKIQRNILLSTRHSGSNLSRVTFLKSFM